jgi:hypothetical protein
LHYDASFEEMKSKFYQPWLCLEDNPGFFESVRNFFKSEKPPES